MLPIAASERACAALDVVEEADELYLVIEYVHGEALSRLFWLTRSKISLIPLGIATAIMSGVLFGLHAAHEVMDENGEPLNVVHRDVSPQNIMVDCDGFYAFSIRDRTPQVGSSLRDKAKSKGKMAYLAPEHIRGGTVDRRSDIYGAGVVLWEMLAGGRLFEGDSDAIVLAKVLSGPTTSLRSLNPDVSEALEAIVLRALDADPENRFATAREMALALQAK